MKFRIVCLLSICSTACAELPPVVGGTGSVAPIQPVIAPKVPASTASYEMMKRLEQMQTEVQQLTGKVEEQAFQIEELKKQQKTMYKDFDDRLQTIENKSDTNQPSAVPESTTLPDSGAAPESLTPPVGQQAKPESKIEESTATDKDVAKPAAPAITSSPGSEADTVSDVEKQDYQQAYDNLRNGKTAEAITEFNSYLTNHPSSGYASNAQYWLGEAYRVNLDNTSARDAFNQVIEKYPSSAKVPDALFKLGVIEMEEKNPEKAREIFTRITNEFASSKAAALAQKKLQTLGSSAH